MSNVLNNAGPPEFATDCIRPANPSSENPSSDEPTCFVRSGAPVRTPAGTPIVPGYEILEELGRGGMGVVYRAWQLSLKRTVALKTVLAGSFARVEDLDRFRAEAMAVARLHHPHLLSIYEIGANQQLPFYAMEYMEGGSLARRLNGSPIDPRAAAELVRSLAEAMDYAHKNGIVHRDLKPANILLSGKEDAPIESCIAKITDFGIAKNLHEDVSHTRTGDILGTPHYMAPEQAIGMSGKVGPTADVYSLGAILYELLTGRAPFHGYEGAAVLIRLTREDPTPLSQIVRGLPDDLQTICLKCLEKDPAHRYASAAALAEDLGRFLRSEPIQAKSASLADRVVKWTQRRPGWTAVIGMTIALALFSFGMMTVMWRQAVAHARTQDELVGAWKSLLADDYLERGIHLAEKGDVGHGMHLMLRALEVAEEIERTEKTSYPLTAAIRMNLAAWRPLAGTREKLLAHADWVWDTEFTADGKFVLTASKDRKLKIWDTETGSQVGEPLIHPHPIWAVVLHPDGKTLFTLCSDDKKKAGQLNVWTMDPDHPGRITPRGEPMILDGDAFLLRLNAPGDRLWLCSYQTGKASLVAFDPQEKGNGLRHLATFAGSHGDGAFSPDGQTLATIGGTRLETTAKVTLWNTLTGAALGQPLEHSGPVRALAFGKDGRHLIVGCATDLDLDQGETSRLQVWDWATAKCINKSAPLFGRIKTMSIAPSGQMFAVSLFEYTRSSEDRSAMNFTDGHVALWQIQADGTIASYGRALRTQNAVWSIAFSPDSRLVLAGSRNSGAFLWSVSNCQQLIRPIWHEGNCVKVAFRGDGRQVVTASAGGNNYAAAKLWEVPSFAHIGPPLPQPDNIRSALWDRSGRHAWFGCGQVLCRWDPFLGVKDEEHRLSRFAYHIHLTSEDRRFLFELGKGDLHEYRCGASAIDLALKRPEHYPTYPQYLVHADRPIVLEHWRKPSQMAIVDPTGKPLTPLITEQDHVLNAARLSADGDLVAVGESKKDNATHRVRIYDTRDLKLVREVLLKASVTALDFSRDARSLAIAGGDRQIQILDVQTGEFQGKPLFHETAIRWIGYAGVNDLLLSCGEKGRVLVWHVPTAKRIGPAFEHDSDLVSHSVHPEGKHLLTATVGRMGMAWRIPEPITGSLARLRLEMAALTGLEMKEHDIIVPIDAEGILAKRRQLVEIGAR